MIAELTMYDWPGIRGQTDTFWAAVRDRLRAQGVAAPDALARLPDHAEGWTHPDLLIGQTCGMPFVSGLCGGAQVIARPDYGLPEAAGGSYRSVIVVRAGAGGTGAQALLARAGCRVAVNEWRSFSGHVTLRAHLAGLRGGAPAPFFGDVVLSGGHLHSARMVARGEADMAALDGVVWALLQMLEPETASALAVIDRTAPAPALPFIAAPAHLPLRAALAGALDAAAQALPATPGLPRRVLPAAADDYAPIRAAARRAAAEPFAPGAPALPEVW